MTLFVDATYQAIVVLDFDAALEVLKAFVVEMNHSRMKESIPFSKSWILKVVAQLVENVLTRPDILNSVKRQFLRILASSELASVDPGWYFKKKLNYDFVSSTTLVYCKTFSSFSKLPPMVPNLRNS